MVTLTFGMNITNAKQKYGLKFYIIPINRYIMMYMIIRSIIHFYIMKYLIGDFE